MAEEIQEAVQIIRVGYDGIEIAMKVCGGTLEEMKKAMDFLIALMDHEKTMGKTDMRRLLMKGGDLQVFQFPTEDMKKVRKMAKKYGLLYSVLPDINQKDGMSEIIFHTEAVPRVNMLVQKLKSGHVATFDDYLKNGDEKEIDKVLSFLKNQKKGNEGLHTEEAVRAGEALSGLIEKVGSYAMEKKSINVEEIKENFSLEREQAEHVVGQLERIGVIEKEEDGQHRVIMDKDAFQNRIRGYYELMQRMQTVAAAQNPNLADITIARKLIAEENDHAIKTRIPGTWGEEARYIWIGKERAMEIHRGKTILTFLDRDKDYKLYSADNRVMGTMKGEELYQGHYDRVSAEVRKRYGDTEQKARDQKQKKKLLPGKELAPLKR
ncbi:PcfB family protein [Candidatus Merdisoma sp. JLR.KK006]|uniref:PcfB family protein n=1 Tax=Candidatus Merdisoma sp. JLR.KK006 TaxID=3112626 RepID=UPI002FF0F7BE